jgi:hypothetical protein
MKKIYHIFASVIVAAALFISCDNDDNVVSTAPPGQITDVRFTPLHGGGYFLYSIPPDEDFLYVRAVYTLDNGQTISKTASVFTDTLFISGLGFAEEYLIRLYSVNRTGNQSEPVLKHITPLEPLPVAVLETVRIQNAFSSVVIDFENESGQLVYVIAEVSVGSRQVTRIFTSNLPIDREVITGLTGEPHNIRVAIRDTYENQTEWMDFGTFEPYIDSPISKRLWNHLRDDLLYGDRWDHDFHPNPLLQRPFPEYMDIWTQDSMRNAAASWYEARIYRFWNNDHDFSPLLNRDFFLTGAVPNIGHAQFPFDGGQIHFHNPAPHFPRSYFIDMGREIKASRLKIWQRDWWSGFSPGARFFSYQNINQFAIWISNDQTPEDGILDDWEYVGTFEIFAPASHIERMVQARAGHEFLLFPDEPRFTRPFRYLRFAILGTFGNTSMASASELTLFGTAADGTLDDDPDVLIGPLPGREF